ncbi:hypothetical protein [Saccharomonospora cyanea]|uniref:hypothetical protein n=1 Tax=Saccharomonospora cyanea TaxID=40989 RepID=UPI0012FCDBF7|nr:hypothetical protein [Saccharomonospora cyanea]
MEEVLNREEVVQDDVLPDELRTIIRKGWYFTPAGAFVLEALEPRSMLAKTFLTKHFRRNRELASHWGGVADYEYHTNDVKIPESGLPSDKERFLSAVAIRALCFIEEAFRSAARFEVSNGLTAVVSVGVGDNYLSHGTTVKFFTRRAGRPDWYEDLERFKIEAIAVLTR